MKIIHIDMDAYYASVEQHDNAALRGKPVVVGGDPRSRGVVATCSYEARRFGVRSAMSCAEAYRRCPSAIFVRPNMSRYVEISRQIRDIFERVTDQVEPLSLDEAYLDVTQNALGMPLARDVAVWIRQAILAATGLTASAGVSSTKLVAKIASDIRKPNGLTVIPPSRAEAFLAPLPVRRLWGVGAATASKLEGLGFRTAADLARADPRELERHLGRFGPLLCRLARGDDPRRVTPERPPKSRGSETTLSVDVLDRQVILRLIDDHASDVADDLTRIRRAGRTITLKIRYADFETVTRSRSLPAPTHDARLISEVARALLDSTRAGERPVRLVGVSVSGFPDASMPEQLVLDFEAGHRLEPHASVTVRAPDPEAH